MTRHYLATGGQAARNVVSMSMKGFVLANGVLYYEGGDTPEKRCLVASIKSSTATSTR